jgi:hypothetical protein
MTLLTTTNYPVTRFEYHTRTFQILGINPICWAKAHAAPPKKLVSAFHLSVLLKLRAANYRFPPILLKKAEGGFAV